MMSVNIDVIVIPALAGFLVGRRVEARRSIVKATRKGLLCEPCRLRCRAPQAHSAASPPPWLAIVAWPHVASDCAPPVRHRRIMIAEARRQGPRAARAAQQAVKRRTAARASQEVTTRATSRTMRVLLAVVRGRVALARARAPGAARVAQPHARRQRVLEPVAHRAPGAHVLRLLLGPDDLRRGPRMSASSSASSARERVELLDAGDGDLVGAPRARSCRRCRSRACPSRARGG